MRYSPETHILIVGAGPSGMGCAEALQERGYEHITVLEKRDRVGGQSLTKHYHTPHGDIPYELGSVSPTGSKRLFELLKRYDLHVDKDPLGLGSEEKPPPPLHVKGFSIKENRVVVDFLRYPLIGKALTPKIATQLFLDFLTIGHQLLKYHRLRKPGFTRLSKADSAILAIPFEEWIDQLHLRVVGDNLKALLRVFLLGIDPQSYNQFPAIHALKTIFRLLRSPQRYINGTAQCVREGYQELYKRMAQTKRIELSSEVKSIVRNEQNIIVRSEKGEYLGDKLILTCSPKPLLKMLDCTPEERDIFRQVHYSHLWRVAFVARGLPCDAAYVMWDPLLTPTGKPALSFYPEGKIADGIWLYSGAFSESHDQPLNTLQKIGEQFAKEHFNAEILEWVDSCYWPDYNPYFPQQSIAQDIYERWEGLQGKQNCHYVGHAISGGLHATAVEYSYDLVNRFF